jgi:hypothetical protein
VKVTNATGAALYVAAIQKVVQDGESIDVAADLGNALAAQGWRKGRKSATAAPGDEGVTTNETPETDIINEDPTAGAVAYTED